MEDWLEWFSQELIGKTEGKSTPSFVKAVDARVCRFIRILGDRWITLEGLQTLEYLMRAWNIHNRLGNDLVCLALPLHHRPLFVRLLQACGEGKGLLALFDKVRKSGNCVKIADLLRLIESSANFKRIVFFSLTVIEQAGELYNRTHRIFVQRFLYEMIANGPRRLLDGSDILDIFKRLAKMPELRVLYNLALQKFSVRVSLSALHIDQLLDDLIDSNILDVIIGTQYAQPKVALKPAAETDSSQGFVRYRLFNDESEYHGIPFITSVTWQALSPKATQMAKQSFEKILDAHAKADLRQVQLSLNFLKVILRSQVLAILEENETSTPTAINGQDMPFSDSIARFEELWMSDRIWSDLKAKSPRAHDNVVMNLVEDAESFKNMVSPVANDLSVIDSFLQEMKKRISEYAVDPRHKNIPIAQEQAPDYPSLVQTMTSEELVAVGTTTHSLEFASAALIRLDKKTHEKASLLPILSHVITIGSDMDMQSSVRDILHNIVSAIADSLECPLGSYAKEIKDRPSMSIDELRFHLSKCCYIPSMTNPVIQQFYESTTEGAFTYLAVLFSKNVAVDSLETIHRCLKAITALSIEHESRETHNALISLYEKLVHAVNKTRHVSELLEFQVFILAQLLTMSSAFDVKVSLSESLIKKNLTVIADNIDALSLSGKASLLSHAHLYHIHKYLESHLKQTNLWTSKTSLDRLVMTLVIGCFSQLRHDEEMLYDWAVELFCKAEKSFSRDQNDETQIRNLLGFLSTIMQMKPHPKLQFVTKNNEPTQLISICLEYLKDAKAVDEEPIHLKELDFLGYLSYHIDRKYIKNTIRSTLIRLARYKNFVSHSIAKSLRTYGSSLLGDVDSSIWHDIFITMVEAGKDCWCSASGIGAQLQLWLSSGETEDAAVIAKLNAEFTANVNWINRAMAFAKACQPEEKTKICTKICAAILNVYLEEANEEKALIIDLARLNGALLDNLKDGEDLGAIIDQLMIQSTGPQIELVRSLADQAVGSGLVQVGQNADYYNILSCRLRHESSLPPVSDDEFVHLNTFEFPIHYFNHSSDDLFCKFLIFWNQKIVEEMLSTQFVDFVRPTTSKYQSRLRQFMEDLGEDDSTALVEKAKELIHKSRKHLNTKLLDETIGFTTLMIVHSPFADIEFWLAECLTIADDTSIPQPDCLEAAIAILSLNATEEVIAHMAQKLCAYIDRYLLAKLAKSTVRRLKSWSHFSSWESVLAILAALGPYVLSCEEGASIFKTLVWTPRNVLQLQLAANAHTELSLDQFWKAVSAADAGEKQLIFGKRMLGRRLAQRIALTNTDQSSTKAYNTHHLKDETLSHLDIYAAVFATACEQASSFELLISWVAQNLQEDLQKQDDLSPQFLNSLYALSFILSKSKGEYLKDYLDVLTSLIELIMAYLASTFESKNHKKSVTEVSAKEALRHLASSKATFSHPEWLNLRYQSDKETELNATFDIPSIAKALDNKQHSEIIPDEEEAMQKITEYELQINFNDFEVALCQLFCSLLLKCSSSAITKAINTILLGARNGADRCLGHRLGDSREVISLKDYYLSRLFAFMYRSCADLGGALVVSGSIGQVQDDLITMLKIAVADNLFSGELDNSKKKKRREISTWYWFELGVPSLLAMHKACQALNNARSLMPDTITTQSLAISNDLVQTLIKAFQYFQKLPRFPAVGSYLGVYEESQQSSKSLEISKLWYLVLRNTLVEILAVAATDTAILTVTFDQLVEACIEYESLNTKIVIMRCIHQAWSSLGQLMMPVLDDTLKLVIHLLDSPDPEINALARVVTLTIERSTGESLAGRLTF